MPERGTVITPPPQNKRRPSARVGDGYQPAQALNSTPPKGGSGLPSPAFGATREQVDTGAATTAPPPPKKS
jgi:hypothetical protein